jgi:hypothetical protein
MGGCGLDSRGRLRLVNTIAYLRIQHNAVNIMSRLATVKFSKWNSLSTPARSSIPAILKLFFGIGYLRAAVFQNCGTVL